MVIAYRLIFEISVYYAVSGLYVQALFGAVPSLAGMILLCLAVTLCAFWEEKGIAAPWQSIALLLPAGVVLFWPGWIGLIHLLPVWIYSAASILSGRADTDHKTFCERFCRAFLFLLIAVLPLCGRPDIKALLGGISVNLTLLLLSGVACLRCLRDRQDGHRNLLSVALVTALCLILTVLQVPQLVTVLFSDYVFGILWRGFALLASLVAHCIFEAFKWLLSLNGPPPDTLRSNAAMTTTAEIIGVDPGALMSDMGAALWLEIAVYIILAVAILVAAVLLARYLIKNGLRLHRSEQNNLWKEERVSLQKGMRPAKRRRRRPQNPRQAVRYYYALFLNECRSRGVEVQPDMTSQDLSQASAACFAPQDVAAFTETYRPARYSERTAVTQQQAKQAAKLWQKMKKTK